MTADKNIDLRLSKDHEKYCVLIVTGDLQHPLRYCFKPHNYECTKTLSPGLNLNTTPQAIILRHVRTQTKELNEVRSKRYSKTLEYYSMKSIEQKLKSLIYVLVDLVYKRRAVRSTTLRSTTLCGQCQTQSLNWTGVCVTFFVIELCPTHPVHRWFQPLANI